MIQSSLTEGLSGRNRNGWNGMRTEIEHILEALREMLGEWEMIARGHAERTGSRLVCTMCDVVPQEVLASFGITAIRVPFAGYAGGTQHWLDGRIEDALRFCEKVIVPRGCPAGERVLERFPERVLSFSVPHGYGEDAAVALHESIDALLKSLGVQGIDGLDGKRLAGAAVRYDSVRRLVRGISSLRASRRKWLLPAELMEIYQAASVLPPESVVDQLTCMLEALNGLPPAEMPPPSHTVLVRGGFLDNACVLDEIERAGCVVAEDDICNGRRQFDISHNPESKGLYYEMLDALSYRPLCPSLRPVNERFDLLYRDLKNYGIEMVVFLRDTLDRAMAAELETLRVRLMRTGIDPIILEAGDAFHSVTEYLTAIGIPSP